MYVFYHKRWKSFDKHFIILEKVSNIIKKNGELMNLLYIIRNI